MRTVIDMAKAVTAKLIAAEEGTFSVDFTPVFKVLPSYDLSDLAELKVSVVPKNTAIEEVTRSMSQYDMQVDIGIQKKLPSGCNEENEVEALVNLADEIAEYLRVNPLEDAVWITSNNELPYVPEHLAERRVFTSVLTLTYRTMR